MMRPNCAGNEQIKLNVIPICVSQYVTQIPEEITIYENQLKSLG